MTEVKKKRKKGMSPSKCRKKGYEFACEVAERLKAFAPDLPPGDIYAELPFKPGTDIILGKAALEIYPLAIECKFQKTVSIHAWIRQAETKRSEGIYPVVCFRRAQSGTKKANIKIQVCLDLEDFLKLIR